MKPDAWMHRSSMGRMVTTGQHMDSYPLYSAATIRKWLSEEISQQVFDAGGHCTGGFEDTYRAMIAAKLLELEGGE